MIAQIYAGIAFYTEYELYRLALAFYCIGSLDLLGVVEEQVSLQDRNLWKLWLWEQQTRKRIQSESPVPQNTMYVCSHFSTSLRRKIRYGIQAEPVHDSATHSFTRTRTRTSGKQTRSPWKALTASVVQESEYGSYDTPHIIMTYTALISLAILRDDFATLDRAGLLCFLSTCQREDGR